MAEQNPDNQFQTVNEIQVNAMRILRLIRTFALWPIPAIGAGYVICHKLQLPYFAADRLRDLVKKERIRIFDL